MLRAVVFYIWFLDSGIVRKSTFGISGDPRLELNEYLVWDRGTLVVYCPILIIRGRNHLTWPPRQQTIFIADHLLVDIMISKSAFEVLTTSRWYKICQFLSFEWAAYKCSGYIFSMCFQLQWFKPHEHGVQICM